MTINEIGDRLATELGFTLKLEYYVSDGWKVIFDEEGELFIYEDGVKWDDNQYPCLFRDTPEEAIQAFWYMLVNLTGTQRIVTPGVGRTRTWSNWDGTKFIEKSDPWL